VDLSSIPAPTSFDMALQGFIGLYLLYRHTRKRNRQESESADLGEQRILSITDHPMNPYASPSIHRKRRAA
jgi:hypothetical protein